MEVKKCGGCGEIKPLSEFNKKKDSYQSKCKECNKAYLREHYKKNKNYYNNKQKTYKQNVRDWYNEYKETLKCEKCGESDAICLDFHHENEKEFTIAQAVSSNVSIERIKEEIKKCIVLCANCHRKIHFYGKL